MIKKIFRFHGYGSLKFVYSKGQTVRFSYAQLKYNKNPRRTESRLAVVVAKKVAKQAPLRNRIRRRLYEAFRRQWGMIEPGVDMVVTVFDARVAEASATEVDRLVGELLKKAGLYKK